MAGKKVIWKFENINYLCSWLDTKERIKTPPDSKLPPLAPILTDSTNVKK